MQAKPLPNTVHTPDMPRRKLLQAGTLAAGTGALAHPLFAVAQTGPIRIGHLTPMTGFLGALGEYAAQGIKMAAEEINAAGGLLGRQIDLISEELREEIKAALLKALRTKAPGYCVSGVSRQGCEDLMMDIQRWLDAQRIAEIESAQPDVRFLDDVALDTSPRQDRDDAV